MMSRFHHLHLILFDVEQRKSPEQAVGSKLLSATAGCEMQAFPWDRTNAPHLKEPQSPAPRLFIVNSADLSWSVLVV